MGLSEKEMIRNREEERGEMGGLMASSERETTS